MAKNIAEVRAILGPDGLSGWLERAITLIELLQDHLAGFHTSCTCEEKIHEFLGDED